jgi:subtilase family serine protease
MARRARRSILAVVVGVLVPVFASGAQKPNAKDRVLPNIDVRVTLPRNAPALDAESQTLLDELRKTRPEIRSRQRGDGAGVKELHANGQPFTPAAQGSPEQIARRFLARYHHLLGLENKDLQSLRKIREYRGHNERALHLEFDQSFDGIGVLGGRLQFHLSPNGEILRVASTIIAGGDVPKAQIAADDAVRAAISNIRPELLFNPAAVGGSSGTDQRTTFGRGPFKSDIDANLVIFPMSTGNRLAWSVVLEPPGLPQKYQVLIDAVTRELLYRRNLVFYADGTGRVLQSDATAGINLKLLDPYPFGSQPGPIFGCPPATNHMLRGLTAQFRDSATVLGNTGFLAGNNTHVYRGVPGTEGAVGTVQPDGYHFDFGFNTPESAETQLFFLTNFLHDFFYDLGFDEAAGNFQDSNFGRGGLEGDALAAVARSTAGKNNSTFEPNPDGQVSIMSMYLWDGSNCWAQDVDGDGTLDLDGDYDTDIAIHEFHHGVSNRLNTQWTGIEADAMGEGGSDFFAYSINNNTTLAEYAYPPNGIRSITGQTYGDFYCLSFFGMVICEPHDNGQIFADVLWDLRERLRTDAVGGSQAAGINMSHQLYVDALKLSPPSPTMLDLRDAIVDADGIRNPSGDPGGSVNHCRIWDVFATRGMGALAQDTDDTGTASVVEDFTVPAECPALPPPPSVSVEATVATATEAGVVPGQFRLTRTGDTSSALTVYFTVSGTATAGSDYVTLPPSVTFAAGAATANVAVTPIDDTIVESNETVVLTVTGSVGYKVGTPSAATVTIISDDVAPDLVVSALTVPATAAAGGVITVTSTTKNQGTGSAVASTTRYYFSADTGIDASDAVLGTSAIGPLGPGASTPSSLNLTIPANAAAGTYFLIAQADSDNTNPETSEANNIRSVAFKVGPDLTISAISVPSIAAAGATVTVTDTTKNGGGGPAAASVTRFYFSSDTTIDATDAMIGFRSVPALASNATSPGSTNVVIPSTATTGTYYIIAKADADGAVAETVETNNNGQATVKVGPDLYISAISATGTFGAGGQITISETTKNQGASASVASTTTYYLSTNNAVDASDPVLGSRSVPALAGGAVSSGTTTVTIPANTATGTYYLLAQADSGGTNAETVETNNVGFASGVKIGPDLVVSALTGSTNAASGGTVSVTETTKNSGGGPAGASTTRYYFSANTTLDAGDTQIGARSVPGLAALATSVQTSTLTLPGNIATGTYYILASADADGVVTETVETNNTTVLTIHVGPDLVVTALSAPGSPLPGDSMTVTDTTKNQGVGDAPASTTSYYLSTNATFESSDVLIGSRSVSALAGNGGTNSGPGTITIPANTAPGSYYVLAVADGPSAVPETIETNNVLAVSLKVGPDLIASGLTKPTSVSSGTVVTLTDTTKNQGGATPNTSTTYLYFSTNTALDAADTLLGSRVVPALGAGATSSSPMNVTIPAGLATGTYYIIVKVDGDNTVSESNETNNLLAVAISVKK